MKKILIIAFLMFFVHSFTLEFLVNRLDSYIPKYNGDTDHGMHFIIALFFTLVFFIFSVVLVFIEYKMEFNYKSIMLFLVFGNCLVEFYMCSFCEFKLFSSPERFEISSILIILTYFVCELFLTFYVINRLYKEK